MFTLMNRLAASSGSYESYVVLAMALFALLGPPLPVEPSLSTVFWIAFWLILSVLFVRVTSRFGRDVARAMTPE